MCASQEAPSQLMLPPPKFGGSRVYSFVCVLPLERLVRFSNQTALRGNNFTTNLTDLNQLGQDESAKIPESSRGFCKKLIGRYPEHLTQVIKFKNYVYQVRKCEVSALSRPSKPLRILKLTLPIITHCIKWSPNKCDTHTSENGNNFSMFRLMQHKFFKLPGYMAR